MPSGTDRSSQGRVAAALPRTLDGEDRSLIVVVQGKGVSNSLLPQALSVFVLLVTLSAFFLCPVLSVPPGFHTHSRSTCNLSRLGASCHSVDRGCHLGIVLPFPLLIETWNCRALAVTRISAKTNLDRFIQQVAPLLPFFPWVLTPLSFPLSTLLPLWVLSALPRAMVHRVPRSPIADAATPPVSSPPPPPLAASPSSSLSLLS